VTTPAVASDDASSLLCPACGFDLRGTTSDRCGECGLEIDRAGLRVSGIAWTHRRQTGRVRAYWRTLWQIGLDPNAIRHETARPQEIADGRAFRRVTALLVAIALLTAFAAVVSERDGLAFLAMQPERSFLGSPVPSAKPLLLDLRIPWSAGATLRPVLPVCLILLAFHLTGVQRAVFRTPGLPPSHRERAAAIACYTTAPLALLLPGAICGLLAWVASDNERYPDFGAFPAAVRRALLTAAIVLVAFAVVGTLVRVAQWLARTRHGSLLGAVLALAEWLALALLGSGVILGLLPWCAGCVWIVIDSFR